MFELWRYRRSHTPPQHRELWPEEGQEVGVGLGVGAESPVIDVSDLTLSDHIKKTGQA